jgi:hypothetical protein
MSSERKHHEDDGKSLGRQFFSSLLSESAKLGDDLLLESSRTAPFH